MTSRKPRLVTNATRVPDRSMRAFVVTVVPWTKRPISAGPTAAFSITRRTAATGSSAMLEDFST